MGDGSYHVRLVMERLYLMNEALERHGVQTVQRSRSPSVTLSEIWKHNFTRPRIRNRPRRGELEHLRTRTFSRTHIFQFAIFVASAFYGGCHLGVWNHPFWRRTDEVLWKVSAIFIISFGLFVTVWFRHIKPRLSSRSRHPPGFLENDQDDTIDYTSYLQKGIVGLAVALYAAARLYIIVESGIDLAYPRGSLFEVPLWSRYFPHWS